MRKHLRIFLFLLLCASPALAQRTVVTGTVTDPNGLAWVGGTIQASLTLPVGASGATLNGVQIGGTTQRTTLDSTGSFLMQLPDNAIVQPPGTQWTFAVSISPGVPPPAGFGPRSFSVTLTITGVSQDVSVALSAAAPVLSAAGASTTCVAAPCVLANGTTATTQPLSDSSTQVATDAFVLANGSPASFGLNVINGSNPVFGLQTGLLARDGTWTAGSPNVSSATAVFNVSMVGQNLAGTINACASDQEAPLAFPAGTTVLSFTDAHHIVASQNAIAGQTTATGCLGVGPSADTAINAMESAGSALPGANCPTYQYPGGIIFLTSLNHFNKNTAVSAACNAFGTSATTHSGPVIGGQSKGSTVFVILPSADPSLCNAGISSNRCMGGISGATYRNFAIFGMNWNRSGQSVAKGLFSVGLNDLVEDVTMSGYGISDAQLGGLEGDGSEGYSIINSSFDGFGRSMSFSSSGQILQSFMGDMLATPSITFTGFVNSTQLAFAPGLGANNQYVLDNQATLWNSTNDLCSANVNVGNIICVKQEGVAHFTNANFNMNNGNASSAALQPFSAASVTTAVGSTFAGGATGTAVNRAAGLYQDLGGNTYVNGTTGIAPACTFSTGGGTTPSCALLAGSTNEKGTIIATTGTGAPGSTGTITLTFAGTFAGGTGAAPACTFTLDNSGTAWGNESVVFVSTQSTTAPVLAWSNVATAVLTALATSSPYRISYTCAAR